MLEQDYTYIRLSETLASSCLHSTFANFTSVWTLPEKPYTNMAPAGQQDLTPHGRDYRPLCMEMFETIGDVVADLMWQFARQFTEQLPDRICRMLSTC
jgi:hypothetical protein